MGSWNALLAELNRQPDDAAKNAYLSATMMGALKKIGELRGNAFGAPPRNVIVYTSAFLQKPGIPGDRIMITHEDLNGLMAVVHGMDCSSGLTLLLHTPGGVTNAAESLVAYLRSKFTSVEVLVPALAMSAGTMIALSSERVIMGRQSQLGPIDPQMPVGAGRNVSARAIVEQFDRAKEEVLDNQAAAHVWAPIVQSLGPALLQEAQNVLDYSETMVAKWLQTGMCATDDDPESAGRRIAHHFNDATTHKSHGRRIDRDEARGQGVVVDDLEDDQDLQEAALTAYHLSTILFEQGPAAKMMMASHGPIWVKNWGQTPPAPPAPA